MPTEADFGICKLQLRRLCGFNSLSAQLEDLLGSSFRLLSLHIDMRQIRTAQTSIVSSFTIADDLAHAIRFLLAAGTTGLTGHGPDQLPNNFEYGLMRSRSSLRIISKIGSPFL